MSKFWSTEDDDSSSSYGNEESAVHSEDFQNEVDGELSEEDEMLPDDPNATWDKIKNKQIFLEPLISTNEKGPKCTRVVCISDTHGRHRDLYLPDGDILIHAGDVTKMGEPGTIADLCEFFSEARFDEIILIAGNHDMTLQPEYYEESWSIHHRKRFDCVLAQDSIKYCHYLRDTSYRTKDDLHIHGSPWSVEFYDWAFMLPRGEAIRKIWKEIPDVTDILITHGPPLGRGDLTRDNTRAGCYDLLEEVQKRIKPKVHVFGHIHEGAGISYDGQVLYINASSLDLSYRPVNFPVVVDVPHDPSKPAMVVPAKCSMDSKGLADWFDENGFERLSQIFASRDTDDLPSGDELLSQGAFEKVACQLGLCRYEDCNLLRAALAKLYADSFPRHN